MLWFSCCEPTGVCRPCTLNARILALLSGLAAAMAIKSEQHLISQRLPVGIWLFELEMARQRSGVGCSSSLQDSINTDKAALKGPSYGRLILLGTNGGATRPEISRNGDTCLDLFQRPCSNGVTPGPVSFVPDSTKSEVFVNPNRHAVSYTFNRTNTVVVEYVPNPNIDLFQIGRYKSPVIDFHIGDAALPTETTPANESNPFLCRRRGKFFPGIFDRSSPSPKKPMGALFTVSRFACRIDIDRRPPHTARIYAAGFDMRNNIFLGVIEEDNVLEDGTLIDLFGAILIWRSAEGLKNGLTLTDIGEMVNILNQLHIQCPVYLKTLHFEGFGAPRIPSEYFCSAASGQDFSSSSIGATFGGGGQPHVYLNCGHVHGYHDWQPSNQQFSSEQDKRTCPLCRQTSRFVRISVGEEVGFFVDRGAPSHCFNPCGHIASEATVRFWSKLKLPATSQTPMLSKCPFCAHVIEGPPVRLIFQHRADESTLKEAFEAFNCTPFDSPHRANPFVFAPVTTPTASADVDSVID
ncbi:Protein pellino [Echinococcus granulosus]|uniref:Protein pellino n=1 Tax=Echinococcus granulosus TaxID=6210 RepID=W6V8E7_ECHGR|nr:Protein pellino [Echinococcus granulosus]EUB62789.1 Protein pellino [Echinococcus granulosus]